MCSATSLSALLLCFAVKSFADEADIGSKAVAKEFVIITAGKFSVTPEASMNFGAKIAAPLKDMHVDPPFTQAAVKQKTDVAKRGPRTDAPYFNARFALPIPPDNDTNLSGALLGIDPYVWSHNH